MNLEPESNSSVLGPDLEPRQEEQTGSPNRTSGLDLEITLRPKKKNSEEEDSEAKIKDRGGLREKKKT